MAGNEKRIKGDEEMKKVIVFILLKIIEVSAILGLLYLSFETQKYFNLIGQGEIFFSWRGFGASSLFLYIVIMCLFVIVLSVWSLVYFNWKIVNRIIK